MGIAQRIAELLHRPAMRAGELGMTCAFAVVFLALAVNGFGEN